MISSESTKLKKIASQKFLLSPGSSISLLNIEPGSVFYNEGNIDLVLAKGSLTDPALAEGSIINTGFTVKLPKGITTITISNASRTERGSFSIIHPDITLDGQSAV